MIGENLQMQDEKADTGEEDEAAQPGGDLADEAPADEIGKPDFPHGYGQGGDAGAPGRDSQNLVAQQVEPVEQMGFVQIVHAVEGGGQPGPGRQHLLRDQGVHGLRPRERELPEEGEVETQADQRQGGAVHPGESRGAEA